MSYLRKIGFNIIPEHSFNIIRNCSGCGCKAVFHNTNRFRVNANGNKLDVWLIYQCIKCKHTSNLTVYKRQNPESLLQQEYEKFLSNSQDLAFEYGTNSQFFAQNSAEVDWSNIKYTIKCQSNIPDEKDHFFRKDDLIVVSNCYMIKIRTDKIVSEILNLSRSKLKEIEKLGIVTVIEEKKQHEIFIILAGDLI